MSRRNHGGGHGGSWKVAYADFVTSMMAFFLVMWLISADEETKKAIEDYFRGEMKRPGGEGIVKDKKAGLEIHPRLDTDPKDLIQLQELKRTIAKLEKILQNSNQPGQDIIRFEYLADGVRIIAIDRAKKPFFEPGTANLTEFGNWVLQTIAYEVERQPFRVEVEGHTQKGGERGPSKPGEDGIGWNLSTFRAISAKDALSTGGVAQERFFRVAGYADRQPLNANDPESEENRRISIVIRRAEDKLIESDKPLYEQLPK